MATTVKPLAVESHQRWRSSIGFSYTVTGVDGTEARIRMDDGEERGPWLTSQILRDEYLGSVVRLLCSEHDGLCDGHRSGDIAIDAKCPGMCDAPGCREPLVDEGVGGHGDASYCPGHGALVAAGAEPQELLDACIKADRYGVTLARLLREAIRMVPLDPGA